MFHRHHLTMTSPNKRPPLKIRHTRSKKGDLISCATTRPALHTRHLVVISLGAVETKPVRITRSEKTYSTTRQRHLGHQGCDFMFTAHMHYPFLAVFIINILYRHHQRRQHQYAPRPLCLQPAQPVSEADGGKRPQPDSAVLC